MVNGSPEMIGTIPHIVYIMYQCMFAVITPAEGVSFASNLQLAYNNARAASKIAVAYSKL